jgi:hypothetical protein
MLLGLTQVWDLYCRIINCYILFSKYGTVGRIISLIELVKKVNYSLNKTITNRKTF